MKKIILFLSFLVVSVSLNAKDFTVASPDQKLSVKISVNKTVTYQLSYDGQLLLKPSQVSMKIAGGKTWGVGSRLKKAKMEVLNGQIKSQFYKKAQVDNTCRQITLPFSDGFSIVFRVYNDGFAYHFVSSQKKPYNVESEQAEFNFAKDWKTVIPYVRSSGDFEAQLHNSFENTYTVCNLSQTDPKKLAFMPILVKADNGVTMAVTEADLEDYPGMYLVNAGNGTSMKGYFARYPKNEKQGGYLNIQYIVDGREPYIAKASGPRSYPWRIISVATSDKQLLDDDMVYRLASPSRIDDTSWIKPGKVAWDWWNAWGVYGVDFKVGINTRTYKHFIDFAERHGIEYIIMDDGWSVKDKADLFQIVPEIDLQEIVNYGKQHNVGVILWAGAYALGRDMEHACKHYSEMGVKGFKVDFFDRDDAVCVDLHYRIAAMAAKYHLVIDFHGTYKPTGLSRTYPNVLNFEGVCGQEQVKWSTLQQYNQPLYDVTVPYARMLAGQMDYTQGAMINSNKNGFRPVNERPMSQGTRCHQMAEYVVFFSPLNMLCDSPTNYDNNEECTDFISSVPTVWDETVPIAGEVGEYVAVARRKGGKWFVGATTNWTPRKLELDLSPLKVGGRKATMFADGLNADRIAEDYVKKSVTVPSDGKLTVDLASGGGVAIMIE